MTIPAKPLNDAHWVGFFMASSHLKWLFIQIKFQPPILGGCFTLFVTTQPLNAIKLMATIKDCPYVNRDFL